VNAAITAFLYVAIGTSVGALTFLLGQRASGRTPKEVDECHEQAALLDGVKRDLDHLAEDATRADAAPPAREQLERAAERLDETIAQLRRGADLVV
jgi:hypothetical protein